MNCLFLNFGFSDAYQTYNNVQNYNNTPQQNIHGAPSNGFYPALHHDNPPAPIVRRESQIYNYSPGPAAAPPPQHHYSESPRAPPQVPQYDNGRDFDTPISYIGIRKVSKDMENIRNSTPPQPQMQLQQQHQPISKSEV